MATLRPPIKSEILESISKCLGDFVSNTEINKFLPESGLTNVDEVNSKWKRIYNSFAEYQNKVGCSNAIRIFIQKVASPVRFINNEEGYEKFRIALNRCLLFCGLELTKEGKYRIVQAASTIYEAQTRANMLAIRLKERSVHDNVLNFCKAELVQENYFHAVLECTKSIAEKIRMMSVSGKDGGELIDYAFGLGKSNSPIIALNALASDSELSEQKGFCNLLKGFLGMFRNTTAHAPKLIWTLEVEDALDCLTMASLIYRKLEKCRVNIPEILTTPN